MNEEVPLFATNLQYLDPQFAQLAVAKRSVYEPGSKRADSKSFPVAMYDGRLICRRECARSAQKCLETKGFALVQMTGREHKLATQFDIKRLETEPALRTTYFKSVEASVQRVTNATYVRGFNVVLRNTKIVGVHTKPTGDNSARGPVNDVHCDFAHDRAAAVRDVQRVQQKLGLGDCRLTLINCWRNIRENEPVLDWPMAVCDTSSILGDRDLVPRVTPENGNHIYNLLYHKKHKWYTFEQMMSDELLLFKQFDSDTHVPTPHTAFNSPRSPPNAPPRYSCEARCMCFFAPTEEEIGATAFLKLQHALRRLKASGVGLVNPAALSLLHSPSKETIGRSKI